MDNEVYALAVSGSDLYVGGLFSSAGGISANNVARWNGSTWSALGTGTSGRVFALVASGSTIYAGGTFLTAGGATVSNVARWNGNAWSALGAGMDDEVFAMTMSGTNLFAGGRFTTAGVTSAPGIARWNGTAWSALGSGVNGSVSVIATSGTDVYAGGTFTTAGGASANNLARWNGSTWSPVGTGVNGPVYALAWTGSVLWVGGNFSVAATDFSFVGGVVPAEGIVRWNGTNWSALGSGMNGQIQALAFSGGDLYAGGTFTGAGGALANHIARWNGSNWSALGSGLNGDVDALAVSGTNLYVAGSFTTAGGSAANRIARWNGSAWSVLGSGIPSGVATLAVLGPDLYAGGYFTTAGGIPANRIAKWDGTSWSAVGSGMNGDVLALAVSGTDLYAGGRFTTADGATANRVAKWNGTAWSPLGSGLPTGPGLPWHNAWVYALAVSGNTVYAGGLIFDTANVPTFIAQWDGTAWSTPGTGADGIVDTLVVAGSDLYVGGSFDMAGGIAASGIAQWNGIGWSALGSGTNGSVRALAISGTSLYAGGSFTQAGGKTSAYLARAAISVSTRDIAVEHPTGTNLADSVGSIDFGTLAFGVSSPAKSFTIRNTSTSNLTITGVATGGTHSGDFAVNTTGMASSLTPGASTTFIVTFTPGGAGGRAANLAISSNDPDESPFEIFLSGTGPASAPEIAVLGNGTSIADGDTSPDSADHTDFGGTLVPGGTVTRTFAITNVGSENLTLGTVSVDGTHPADFTVMSQPISPVAAGGSTTFQVKFQPTGTGPRTGILSFSTNDGDENPFNFSIQGIWTGPEIAVSGNATNIDNGDPTPSTGDHTDFGTTGLDGGTVTRTFLISSSGTANVTVGTVSVGGPHASDFTITGSPASPVAPGGYTTFAVTFDPSDIGTRSATLSFSNNDGDENPFNFSIQGTGAASIPEIAVSGGGNVIADGSATPDLGNGTYFGSITEASGTVTRIFTIANLGYATLNLGTVSIAGSDFVVAQQPSSSVLPGATTTFRITFDPSAIGTRPASLSCTTNDADENPFNFSISGIGLPLQYPEIAVTGNNANIATGDTSPSPDDHTDFGTCAVTGATVTRTFTIANSGTNWLTVNSLSFSGANASDFTVSAAPETTIDAGRTTTFQIRFDPSATGTRTATLSLINTDADESPFTFNLQGTSTAPEIAVTGNETDIATGDSTPSPTDHTHFGSILVSGQNVSRTFTISNLGTANLNLGAVSFGGTNPEDFAVTEAAASTVPAGTSTTLKVRFAPILPGNRSATLSFATNDSGENPFTFAIAGSEPLTDADTNGFTDAEEAAIVALRTRYVVGETVALDLGFLRLSGTQTLIITGLPPGVKYNPQNRRIEGTITGELDGDSGEIRMLNGPAILASMPFNLSVAPYPFLGSFEGLLENGALPAGKAKITITGPGVFSATLERQGEPARSTRGTFAPSGGATQSVAVTFPLGRSFPETTVSFVIPSTSDLVTGNNESSSLRGFRLVKPDRSWPQRINVAFDNTTPGNRTTTPGGTGYATGSLNSTGLLPLTSVLGDGQAVTMALSLSQTNQAVVFVQPYVDKAQSFFGGILTIGDLVAPGRGGSLESQPAGLQWRKAPIATALSYPGGFGPLGVNGRVSKWVSVGSAEGLALSLGLNLRRIELTYTAPPAGVMPTQLGLRNTLSLVRLLPANSVAWTAKAVSSNGTFSGALEKNAVSGVLLQDAAFGTEVGAGFIKIPVTSAVKGSFETAGIRLRSDR